MSHNKKKSMEMSEQKEPTDLESRLNQELQKKERITMDVKQLLTMINSYEKEDVEMKRQNARKNRITLDIFAISQML